MTKTRAFHFLRTDMTAGSGNEPAWTVGETRTVPQQSVMLCRVGYHAGLTWYDALQYAPGPIACVVELSGLSDQDETKLVARTRTLIAAINVERELRLWGCACAERALLRERKAGREPSPNSWRAIEVSRLFAENKASSLELALACKAAWEAGWEAGWGAAWGAAWEAAREAAWGAAWEAAREAAWGAARGATRKAEVQRQRQSLEVVLNELVKVGE